MQKASEGLYSLSILWGDGGITKVKAPLGNSWCHHYADTGVFEQTYELADSAGCKDKTFKYKVHIVPSPTITATHDSVYSCDSTRYCFTASAIHGKSFTYQWKVDPSNAVLGTGNKFCKKIRRGDIAFFNGIVTNEYGCKDTVRTKVRSADSGISFGVAMRKICTSQVNAGISFNAGTPVDWEMNGNKLGKASFITIFNAKVGWNYVKISTNVPCPMTYTDSFFVSVFNIKAIIKNEFRAKVIDTLWVQDLSKNVPGSRIRRLWSFNDRYATACTTWAKKNQFPLTNCNYSKDTIAWHYYGKAECFYVRLSLFDSTTLCEADTVMQMARSEFCNPFIVKKQICMDEFASFNISDLLLKKVKSKNYIITDSKGKADTLSFQGTLKGYKYNTPGYKSPIFLRYYEPDTVWTERKGKLVIDYIRPGRGWVADTFKNGVFVMYKPNAKFTVKKLGNCSPSKAEIKFEDSVWYQPMQMSVDWGDTLINYGNYTDTVAKLPILTHTYKVARDYIIEVVLTPKSGCTAKFAVPINFGYYTRFLSLFSCTNKICFRDTVQDYDGKNRWTSTNKLGNIYWDFGDGTKDSGFSKCHTFTKFGNYTVKLRAVSASGCVTEYSKPVVMSKAVAGIKTQPTIYCSEIRQYFDSSHVLGDTVNGQIVKWTWNFGDGSAPVNMKNPAHIYPVGGTYTAQLIVTTKRGCKDTSYRTFKVRGPEVAAKILFDSMGCAPLRVDFGNLSKNTGNFIWEFGDPNNTFYSTTKDTNVNFTYKKPGVYFAHITGGDSFKNDITGSTYYCSIRYPSPGQNQLRITVYPGYFSAFDIPDTICKNDSFPVLNLSDTTYSTLYKWDMGNKDTFTKPYENFTYKYKKGGNYIIQLRADKPPGTKCVNAAEKRITVLDFVPDFQQDCDKSRPPVIYFENTQGPEGNDYRWTLQNKPDTTQIFLARSKDLQHDFGQDTGLKTICLYFDKGNYCNLKSCRDIVLHNGIYLANVFTPGSIDGYNDTYKVPVYGYQSFELKIFNRWGERIFYSENPYYAWNGKVDNTGAELPTGTYFYQFSYRDYCDKKLKTLNGSINLIR